MRNGITILTINLLLAPLQLNADEHCKTSEWGADDQVGAANRITAASVKAASQLIKTGKTYSLGLTSTPATILYRKTTPQTSFRKKSHTGYF